MTQPPDDRPAEVFLHLILIFLTPLFLQAAGGNIAFARAAAVETLDAYGAKTLADFLPIAQIIAFGLAALDSLNRAMAEDIPHAIVLRFHYSAVRLNRAAETCRRALTPTQPQTAAPLPPRYDPEKQAQRETAALASVAKAEQRLAEAEAKAAARSAPKPAPAAPRPAQQPPAPQPAQPAQANPPIAPEDAENRAAWAAGMARVAREMAAGMDDLSPAERQAATRWIGALGSAAGDLVSGAPLPPSIFPPRPAKPPTPPGT